METQSVVYIGPARPGVVIGDPYNRAAIEAVYGRPVDVPVDVATGLLAQTRTWVAPGRAMELGVQEEDPAPDAESPQDPRQPQEPQEPVTVAPPAGVNVPPEVLTPVVDSTANHAVGLDRKRGDRP